MRKKNNKYVLKSLPSDDDPMWQRVNSIMIREQLFVDSLQSHYDKFVNFSNQSYILWQSQSYNEIVAEKKAKTKAIGRGILGALSIAAAVASASAPKDYNDDYSGEVAMLTLGGKLLEDAAKYKAEAKMHRDSIKELGESIDAELAPNLIEFENKTIELSGNARQQFIEWRKFKKMYELENSRCTAIIMADDFKTKILIEKSKQEKANLFYKCLTILSLVFLCGIVFLVLKNNFLDYFSIGVYENKILEDTSAENKKSIKIDTKDLLEIDIYEECKRYSLVEKNVSLKTFTKLYLRN